jgi:hypothetical protein
VPDGRLPVGTPVQVRNHFDRAWSSGFEVADDGAPEEGYRVRRRSDRTVLPAPFGIGELRPEPGLPVEPPA